MNRLRCNYKKAQRRVPPRHQTHCPEGKPFGSLTMTSKYFLLSGRRGGVTGGDASVLCLGPSSKLCSALTTRFRALHRRATVRYTHGMVQLSQKSNRNVSHSAGKKSTERKCYEGDVIKEMLATPWRDSGSADGNA